MNLEIEDNSFFVLLGPSGCGKTTLLRTIAGFIPPASGSVLFGASDVTRVPAHKRNIGFVFQDHALFPNLTVSDNIAYGLNARNTAGKKIIKKVQEVADMVGLTPFLGRYPSELSGGQRQRVALARALVLRPAVLLMDEPLSSLDTKLRIRMRTVLSKIHDELGITTVWVTHDQEEALDLASRIAVFNNGRIEQSGTPRDIYTKPRTAFVADFIGAANLIEVQSVHPRDSTRACCRLPSGQTIEAVCCPGVDPGKNGGTLVARPEELRITKTIRNAGNQLPGSIVRKQYLGYKTSYLVKVSDRQHLVVDEMVSSPENGVNAGDTVLVTIPETSRIVRS